MAEARLFQWADWLVFSLSLALSVAIGFYYACSGGKQRSTSEYLLGDRKMSFLPVSISLLVSFMSAVSVLGIPSEVYSYGAQVWHHVIGYGIAMFLAAFLYLPVYYHMGVTSAFEFLEVRFNKTVRLVGSILSTLQMLLYSAVATYAPSLALSQVTGFPAWVCIVSAAAVCTFYTTLGGFKAVLWTDTIQFIIMIAGLVATIIKSSIDIGGLGKVWNISAEGGRHNFWELDPNPFRRHAFWPFVFGDTALVLTLYAACQSQVQRFCSVKSLFQAKAAVLSCAIYNLVFISLLVIAGLIMYAYYATCDPQQDHRVNAGDQMLSLLVMEVFQKQPGVPGLFLASVLAAALSTLSSTQNALATIWLEDIIKPAYQTCHGRSLSDSWATWISKVLVVVVGVAIGGLSMLCFVLSRLVLQISTTALALIGGPLLGLFTIGLFCPAANVIGALTGLVCGLGMLAWVTVGALLFNPATPRLPVSTSGCERPVRDATATAPSLTYTTSLFSNYSSTPYSPPSDEPLMIYRLSYRYYALFGFLVVVIVGILVSLITGGGKQCRGENQPQTFCTFYRRTETRKTAYINGSPKHHINDNSNKLEMT